MLYLILKTNFEADSICEYKERKFFIQEISNNRKNIASEF